MFVTPTTKTLPLLLLAALLAACSQKTATPQTKHAIPAQYKVQSGDTVSKIAQRYGLDWRSVSKLNNLDSNHTIYAGQLLTLKGASHSSSTVAPTQKPQKPTTIANNQNLLKNQSPIYNPTPNNHLPTIAQNASLPVSNTQNAPFVGSSAVMKFSYPVGNNNAIAKQFASPTQNGLTEGIFFSGKDGDAVTASLDGMVIGIGNGIAERAYVLVKHDNGYQSAYLDLKNINVYLGQSIKRHQLIGQMQSQTANGLALFEFRIARQGQYIDPISVLK